MGNDLDHLFVRHAIVARSGEMRTKLVGTIHRDQGADRDETAVAFRESRPFPDVPEQNVIGEFGQLRGEIAHQLLGARGLRRGGTGSGWYGYGRFR
jgi:hypothetical protein